MHVGKNHVKGIKRRENVGTMRAMACLAFVFVPAVGGYVAPLNYGGRLSPSSCTIAWWQTTADSNPGHMLRTGAAARAGQGHAVTTMSERTSPLSGRRSNARGSGGFLPLRAVVAANAPSPMVSRKGLNPPVTTTSSTTSLPYFGDKDKASGIDSVLKGVQVGHGIRYSRHPKSILDNPALSKVVKQLHDVGMCTVWEPTCERELDFTFGQIHEVRTEVETAHSLSERKLSALGQLLAQRFTLGKYGIASMATAESNKNVFTLTEHIPLEALDQGADSAQLARDQLSSLSVDGEQVQMIDHSIEFGAEEWNEWGVHRVIARARPHRDLWKVIADSLFGLEHPEVDSFVDDGMYHLKIVVEDDEHADRVHRSLRNIQWTDMELRERGIPVEASTRQAELIEQEVHTAEALGHAVYWGDSASRLKETSGDRSSTVMWWGTAIQIRVQTLNEHYAETEMISMANREKLAIRKEMQQERMADQSPLYGFARNLMRWMLADDALTTPPACGTIQVNVHH